MKRIGILFAALFFMAIFPLQAQVALSPVNNQGGDVLLTFPSTKIASDTTIYSEWFELHKYDANDYYTTPATYAIVQSSATSKPHLSYYLEGSMDKDSAYIVDTLGTTADSVETAHSGTYNFGDTSGARVTRYYYYRFVIKGETGNPADAYGKAQLLFTKPD